MASIRQLHPREEPYRWAIEKLDETFGRDSVRLTPRNHYHVLRVAVSIGSSHHEDLVLRDPTEDLNKRPKREAFLASWMNKIRERQSATAEPVAVRHASAA